MGKADLRANGWERRIYEQAGGQDRFTVKMKVVEILPDLYGLRFPEFEKVVFENWWSVRMFPSEKWVCPSVCLYPERMIAME